MAQLLNWQKNHQFIRRGIVDHPLKIITNFNNTKQQNNCFLTGIPDDARIRLSIFKVDLKLLSDKGWSFSPQGLIKDAIRTFDRKCLIRPFNHNKRHVKESNIRGRQSITDHTKFSLICLSHSVLARVISLIRSHSYCKTIRNLQSSADFPKVKVL